MLTKSFYCHVLLDVTLSFFQNENISFESLFLKCFKKVEPTSLTETAWTLWFQFNAKAKWLIVDTFPRRNIKLHGTLSNQINQILDCLKLWEVRGQQSDFILNWEANPSSSVNCRAIFLKFGIYRFQKTHKLSCKQRRLSLISSIWDSDHFPSAHP